MTTHPWHTVVKNFCWFWWKVVLWCFIPDIQLCSITLDVVHDEVVWYFSKMGLVGRNATRIAKHSETFCINKKEKLGLIWDLQTTTAFWRPCSSSACSSSHTGLPSRNMFPSWGPDPPSNLSPEERLKSEAWGENLVLGKTWANHPCTLVSVAVVYAVVLTIPFNWFFY